MKFAVMYKGTNPFTGSLGAAMLYLELHWTSVVEAYERGVKLVPVSRH